MLKRVIRIACAGAVVASVTAAAPAHATAAVVVQHYAYTPSVLTVTDGEAIAWTNYDSARHDVTSVGAGPLASPELSTGQTWTITLDPGTYGYTCTLHPDMRGTVVVLAAPPVATATTATAVAPSHPTTRAALPASIAAPGAPAATPVSHLDLTVSRAFVALALGLGVLVAASLIVTGRHHRSRR